MEETYKNQINDLLKDIHNTSILAAILKIVFKAFLDETSC